MDFVFDQVATGRTIKCLTIIDDATDETVGMTAEYSISGEYLTRTLDTHCSLRSKPAMIRTDNGPEFIRTTMLTWVHRNGIELRLIQPGKPDQNAYVQSFNGKLRDECPNEHAADYTRFVLN